MERFIENCEKIEKTANSFKLVYFKKWDEEIVV